jgi:SAM-dependent methyltransferase
MLASLAPWCCRCPDCGTWGSTLTPDINGERHAVLDERQREMGLVSLRRRNNERILSRLRDQGLPDSAEMLDVGSAHGWFVRAARDAGHSVQGIEPDEAVARLAEHGGVKPRVGFFPDVLEPGESFDAITFNDVLEHLPDVHGALGAVGRHLKPGGLVSVNIPNSRGIVYRSATVAHRIGITTIFDRLWQCGFPSPHLWYFDEPGLSRLAESEGLEKVYGGVLDSVDRHGLWERAHADRRPSAVTIAGVAGGWLAAPLLNSRWASDIMHLIFRRPAAEER